jgi:phage baseplate assembly protein W
MTDRALYRGFSTRNHLDDPAKGFMVTNQQLVNEDLLNHIYTIPGERPMMPDFGTRISMLAFEPLDQQTISIIEEDLRKVFDYDPRVKLLELSVQAMPDNNTIVAWADLQYLQLGTTETLKLEFPVGS